jgi:uncharacterized protein YxjI
VNQKKLYFSDTFFSTGKTDILTEEEEKIGEIDLKSMFSSSVDILNGKQEVLVSGKFPMLGIHWKVLDRDGTELGKLKEKFAFFSKKYSYEAYDRDTFFIDSELFSKEYVIKREADEAVIATFKKVSGIFSSAAYELDNHSNTLTSPELIAVIMGVNAIQKRNNSSNAVT